MKPSLSHLLLATAVLLAPIARAEDAAWPGKPITYVAPYPAGSPVDVIARRIAQHMQGTLKQPVVVDNRVGAGGSIGAGYVTHAAPDGYTIVAGSISTHAINASLYSKLPYDPVQDFAPVALIGSTQLVLVVNPQKTPAKTVQEFVADARAHPATLQYGSAGNGSSLHLAAELFQSMTRTRLLHVPYKGAGGAMTDLLGGRLDAMFENAPNALPQIRSGKLRALAVTGEHRLPALPEVPTVAETVAPGYRMTTWHAIFAPARTPPAIVQALSQAALAALNAPAEKQFYAERSIDLTPGGPDVLKALVASEIPKWRALVESSGAKVD